MNGTFVRMGLADALSSLEGVKGVGEIHIRIRLVHQLVQGHNGVHHSHLSVVAAGPLRVLQGGKGHIITGEVFSLNLARKAYGLVKTYL